MEKVSFEPGMMMMMMLMLQIKAECLGCRHNAAMFNMSYFGKFYLTGPDAQSAADFIFTNDVRLGPGQLHHRAPAAEVTQRRVLYEPGTYRSCGSVVLIPWKICRGGGRIMF